MKRNLGLVLLFPTAICAQTTTPPTQALVPPQPTRGNFLCMLNYPVKAVLGRKTGTATLLFRVAADGSVAGVVIAASTGNDSLDAASVKCAKSWRIRPATINQQPISAWFSTSVEWVINSTAWKVSLALTKPLGDCVADREAADRKFDAAGGVTVVSYALKNGEVSDASLKESSGDATLDQKALACVTAWRFDPQTVEPDLVMIATLPPGRPSFTRTPDSLAARPATGDFSAVFDWREFGAK